MFVVAVALRENMYQDHLHKITEDSESQRNKRDEIIRNTRKQLGSMEVELQRTRTQLEAEWYIKAIYTVCLLQGFHSLQFTRYLYTHVGMSLLTSLFTFGTISIRLSGP